MVQCFWVFTCPADSDLLWEPAWSRPDGVLGALSFHWFSLHYLFAGKTHQIHLSVTTISLAARVS